jgi:hypothetical protein
MRTGNEPGRQPVVVPRTCSADRVAAPLKADVALVNADRWSLRRFQRRWSPSPTDNPDVPTWPAYPRSETT